MVRRMLTAEVSGVRVRSGPRFGWMDGMKVAYGIRWMTVEAARQFEGRLEEVESLGTYVED